MKAVVAHTHGNDVVRWFQQPSGHVKIPLVHPSTRRDGPWTSLRPCQGSTPSYASSPERKHFQTDVGERVRQRLKRQGYCTRVHRVNKVYGNCFIEKAASIVHAVATSQLRDAVRSHTSYYDAWLRVAGKTSRSYDEEEIHNFLD